MRRLELYAAVPTTVAAIEWCKTKGLLMREVRCQVCNSFMKLAQDNCLDGQIWRCRKTINGQRHERKTSIRQNSFFSGSHLSIKELLYIIYEWAANMGVEQTSFELDIGTISVMKIFKSLRETAGSLLNQNADNQIGGYGIIVEIDECQIGRRKHHRGRVPREIWVFGALERNSRPIRGFIEIVESRDQDTLCSIIQRRINDRSRIISDGWRAYTHLQELGFSHSVVNHSQNFVSPNDSTVYTQNVENLWRCLRRFLNSKGTYTRRHLQEYLDEFMFRKGSVDVFETVVSALEEKLVFIEQ